ncbi:MAG: TIGR04283 family arsenosugar biosynthesis glycosyltransferase [Planctomycetales bacterium]|nr:TIGR04283 family arsenosugar biosynthesis glycosyltransferase [Planctomycetales bacterium]
MPRELISVVIPTLDEEAALPRTIASCAALGPHEIVVPDGGSGDGTRAVAESLGASFLPAPRGRGRQANAGAAAAHGRLLLFLHADTRLPAGAGGEIRRVLEDPAVSAGVFRLRLDAAGVAYRVADAGATLRSRWLRQAGGDQGLFVRRERFAAAGGYPPVPLFEDIELSATLGRLGRLVVSRLAVTSSARRYTAEGPWRRQARNWALRLRHALGEDPASLARRYGSRGDGRPREAVVLLARAPRLGTVKSRLAAGLGPERALGVYRVLGETVAHRLAPALHAGRVGLVAVTPPDALAEVEAWLGPPWRAVPQVEGDLGARIAGAADAAFVAGAHRVVLLGTDCADVAPADVEEAFASLARSDAVLGPAADGGYWLLGLNAPEPSLLRGVPWGTGGVLESTLRAARAEGLDVALLRTLSDVDRPEDLESLAARLPAGGAEDANLRAVVRSVGLDPTTR